MLSGQEIAVFIKERLAGELTTECLVESTSLLVGREHADLD